MDKIGCTTHIIIKPGKPFFVAFPEGPNSSRFGFLSDIRHKATCCIVVLSGEEKEARI
jgi:hypothetical protein